MFALLQAIKKREQHEELKTDDEERHSDDIPDGECLLLYLVCYRYFLLFRDI